METLNPFYCETPDMEYTIADFSDSETTLYIKTGDRRKLNQLIKEYFGFSRSASVWFNTRYNPAEILLETRQLPTVIGTQGFLQPQGWCMADLNNFCKLKDFGLWISKRLATTFIQTLAFHPSSYSYFLYCENGRVLRERENANFVKGTWIDFGSPLPFELKENLHTGTFHCDTLVDYITALGLDLHDTELGNYYTQLLK
jgi:hypothetical protein